MGQEGRMEAMLKAIRAIKVGIRGWGWGMRFGMVGVMNVDVPSCVFGLGSSLCLTRWWGDGGYSVGAAQVFVGRAPRRRCGGGGGETLDAARDAVARSRLEEEGKGGKGNEKECKGRNTTGIGWVISQWGEVEGLYGCDRQASKRN